MIRKILKWPDPILLQACKPWDFDNPPVDNIEQDLLDTLTSEHALGLAANQIGISYQVLAMYRSNSDDKIVMYNPKVLSMSEDLFDAEEGCLSFPGVYLKIARPQTLEAVWQDQNQNAFIADFSDMDAKCFLHELDHLNGRVFKEHVSDLKFNRAVKRAKK